MKNKFRFVTLHTKTAFLFAVGLAGIIFSSLFLTRYFFLFSLNELENIEIHKASSQASFVIRSLSSRQETASYDWAYWNESYDLLAKQDDGFAERNLHVDELDVLGLDFISYLTPDRRFQVGVGRDIEDIESFTTTVINDEGIAHHLIDMQSKLSANKTSISGLIRLDDDIWVVSVSPVRDGAADAPFAGWMIWGQHLSLRFPSAFEGILTASNSIIVDQEEMARLDFHSYDLNSDREHDSGVKRSKSELYHYTSLTDISGKVIAVLETKEPRTYYQKGEAVFYYLIIAIAVVASIVACITFVLFRNNIGKRFNYFEQDIKSLISSSDVDLEGHKDEFERITKLVQSLAHASSKTEGQLKDTLQKFEALYHSQSLGMVLVVEKMIVDVNQMLLDLLGYQREDLVGNNIEILCSHEAGDLCSADQLYINLAQGLRQFEAWLSNKEGDTVYCIIEATQFEQDGRISVMLSIKDISEQKQQAVLIDSLTHKDASTGLLNRPTVINLFKSYFQHSSEGDGFSLLYFNATRLKEIDEIYGHVAHDDVLKHFAECLLRNFGDQSVGRISENEFLVWDEEKNYVHLEEMANRVLEKYSSKMHVSGFEFDIGLKSALVPSSSHFDSFENFSYVGLYALTEIKAASKKGLVIVDEELKVRSKESLSLNRDIMLALKNNEIVPFYQPIVNASNGQVVGFEALARWKHPSLGMIPPGVFIPLAEQRRLIVELGESILDQACQFIKEIQQKSTSSSQNRLSIHVNLSSPHFNHKSLVETLTKMIKKYQLTQGQLVLELTESILLGSEEEIIDRMDVIKSLGVQLALDDFGTGYSSFSSLCNFPLDIIKLDKSYIDALETNDKAKSLVRNIIHMSQELGMTTVAEGVENASQLRKLNVWNVDEVQGYYFFKPMDKESALEKFAR
ncbi:bifunctional diguanylate cyclase/phosphodiesterase [Vibrio ziniensis]|uniref:bifunctional diguanylate cyclase/phosphodiesterase n=1 Tax=Vibrio ziniensis TaxID=2711221 RepID=UPI001FEB936B|nr:EAL domain-containing protein [Vibrio ziniensis]